MGKRTDAHPNPPEGRGLGLLSWHGRIGLMRPIRPIRPMKSRLRVTA